MDARALLRAKKAAAATPSSASAPVATARPGTSATSAPASASTAGANAGFTSDEYATKTKSGETRCRICSVIVKYWQPHLSSKQHKQSLARERAAQQKLVQASQSRSKPLVIVDDALQGEQDANGEDGRQADGYGMNGKRALGDTEPGQELSASAGPSKRRKIAETSGSSAQGQTIADPTSSIDTELDDFLSSLTALPPPPPSDLTTTKPSTSKQPYRLAQAETQTSYESAPIRLVHDSGVANSGGAFGKVGNGVDGPVAPVEQEEGDQDQDGDGEPRARETNAQRVRRERREEADEILARLEEEQRAQEEADQRVTSLKSKLELIKQRRKEAAEAKKKK